jgi:hypothetical protein
MRRNHPLVIESEPGDTFDGPALSGQQAGQHPSEKYNSTVGRVTIDMKINIRNGCK